MSNGSEARTPRAPARIHPTADVSPDARIGAGSQIWDFARIREGAVLGEECIVGRGAYVDAGVLIGDRVKVQNAALLYHGTTIESGAFIGPGAILTNDRYPRSITLDGRLARASDWQVSAIRVGVGSSIGAGAIVVAGTDIEAYGTVGAGAVVTSRVPAHALVAGVPARQLGWVCYCGQRLIAAPDDVPVAASYRGPARCPADASAFEIAHDECRPAPGR
jgi:UDP-3-O-[3-hydroxymyristoyl] glucosamine N-acyltransferase